MRPEESGEPGESGQRRQAHAEAAGRWVAARRLDVAGARELGRRMAIYSGVGVLAALGAAALFGSVHLVASAVSLLIPSLASGTHGAAQRGAAFVALRMPHGVDWLMFLAPAVGALLAGLAMERWAREARGGGVGLVIDAYHRRGGELRARVPFVKLLASALTMGSGGSAGAEGPIAQIGAGLASIVGGRLGLSASERRILTVTGMAAGIGAAFHAPLAGALFAAEVLYSEMEIEDRILVPAILTSTVAYCVYGLMVGWSPILVVPTDGFDSVVHLLPYTALAVVLGGGAIAFSVAIRWTHKHLGEARRIPGWLRPALGGLGVGVLGLFIPSALGMGYGLGQAALDGHLGVGLLLLLAGAKLVATTLTVGSGGSGGKLSPSLVMGAALGSAVGVATQHFFPSLGVSPGAFALVGMAGFFAAASNTPISTVFMVSEIAGSYRLLVPSVWVCAIAWLIARGYGLFPAQVPRKLDAPPQLSELMAAVLRRIRVQDAIASDAPPVVTVAPSTPMRELLTHFASSTQSVFPILDEATGRLEGVVDGRDLRRRIAERGRVDDLLIAHDFLSPAVSVTLTETLYDAFARMTVGEQTTEELLVIDDHESRRLVGLLSRRQIIKTYYERMLDTGGRIQLSAAPPSPTRPAEEGLELLATAIGQGDIVRGIRAATPEDALAEIIARSALPAGLDAAEVVRALLARERLGSTAVGEGIALPHPGPGELGLPEAPVVLLAALSRPLAWDAPDALPVELVGVILCGNQTVHLDLLGALARALSRPEIRGAVLGGANKRRVISLVRGFANARGA